MRLYHADEHDSLPATGLSGKVGWLGEASKRTLESSPQAVHRATFPHPKPFGVSIKVTKLKQGRYVNEQRY